VLSGMEVRVGGGNRAELAASIGIGMTIVRELSVWLDPAIVEEGAHAVRAR